MRKASPEELLRILKETSTPSPDELKNMVVAVDDHRILAKIWLLDGTPHVFANSPMKYLIFKERVADEFDIGSQDVRIVGSARLGYTPSPYKFGRCFMDQSDVDVVIVSEQLFLDGSHELFDCLRSAEPRHEGPGSALDTREENVQVNVYTWRDIKRGVRDFAFGNFNPGLLPDGNALKQSIFGKLKSTSGLFLALEPQVFVSKIRCRVFRSWRSAEDYYTNTLRELRLSQLGTVEEPVEDWGDEEEEAKPEEQPEGVLSHSEPEQQA